jgi:hypothetical protein
MFEFGTFAKSTFPTPNDFFTRMDTFLGSLPTGFRYGVEIRNPEYLGPAYFALLASHRVAHVLSAWTRMPELGTQIDMPDAFTTDFSVVRALLSKGCTYEDAVKTYEPYQLVQKPDLPARDAMRRISVRSRKLGTPALIFVNNRLEGHAPTTIESVADVLLG